MSFNPCTDSSSPPGHQDLDASLAAPAQVDQVGGTLTPERIAEFRAAWAADREERRKAFKRDWPMHLVDLLVHTGLGVSLGLATVLWALQAVGA